MKRLINIILLSVFHNILLYSQTTVFQDNFNTSQGSTFTTSGQIGTSSWYVNRSGDDWGARIDNGILELTNDATTATNTDGWVFAYVNTTNFGASFNPTLNQNTQKVNYIFNMRQPQPNPAGFNSGDYGVAFIIGSTGNSKTTGNGYAIVLGSYGTDIDPIRFVYFTNGLQTNSSLNNLITSSAPLNDIGNEYLSLALSYDPQTNLWELYGRVDGTSSFQNPADGNLSFLGSVTNSTYTNVSLTYAGAYWQGSTTTNKTAFFDNVSIILGDIPLPIELATFNLEVYKNQVKLTWQTATEVNNYGFEIERKYNGPSDVSNNNWEKIGFVQGNGNSNSPKYYSFIDKNLLSGYYSYRLKQIDYDGSYTYSDVLKVKVDYKPQILDVKNYPNPFNPITKIYYEIPEDGFVTLKIYNALGKEIKTLINENKIAGSYEIEFDASGLPTGIYFNVLQVGDKRVVRKMQLIK